MSNQDPMPEPNRNNGPQNGRQTDRWLDPGKLNLQVIYILYLASFAIGITGLVGIVLAHINSGKSEAWLETHYTWAIRTFWLGMLGAVVSFLLMFMMIGMLTMLALAIWVVVRTVVGLQKLSRNEPIDNPKSWLL